MKKQLLLTLTAIVASLTMSAQGIVTTTADDQIFKAGTTNTTLPGYTMVATTGTASSGTTYVQLRGTTALTDNLAGTFEFDLQTAEGTIDGMLWFDFGKLYDADAVVRITVNGGTPQTFTYTGNKGGTSTALESYYTYYTGTLTASTTPMHVKFEIVDLDKSAATSVVSARIYSVHFDKTGALSTNTIIANENKFALYPNPTKGSFELSSIANQNLKSVDVFNVVGQLVKSFGSLERYDISDLKEGTYFVKVSTDISFETIKVVRK